MRTAVLGLGLIGGSVARALEDVVGFDPVAEVREQAAGDGLRVADSAKVAVEGADLVVLAAPVPANDALLAEMPAGCLVTDVGSVKAPIVRQWERLATPPALVPGHPMAGAETAGWAASRPDLFQGARWVLSPGPWAAPQQWLLLSRLVLELGAVVVPADPDRHDRAAAAISHAPHVLASMLSASVAGNSTADLARSLAAGSFRDMTRVTASPPERTAEFCAANGAATASVVEDIIARLEAALDPLRNGDAAEVVDVLRAGHRGRAAFDAARDRLEPDEVPFDEEDPEWMIPLLRLADAGGVVTGVGPGVLHVQRPR